MAQPVSARVFSVAATADPAFVTDAEAHLLTWNDAAESLLGLGRLTAGEGFCPCRGKCPALRSLRGERPVRHFLTSLRDASGGFTRAVVWPAVVRRPETVAQSALLHLLQPLERGLECRHAAPEMGMAAQPFDKRGDALANCERLRRVKEYVLAHCAEPISLRTAAAVAALEQCYFSRFFHRKTGLRFRDWLVQQRVQQAQRLLVREDWDIPRVAYAVGFRDVRTLERAFKRCLGTTPRDFRGRSAVRACKG